LKGGEESNPRGGKSGYTPHFKGGVSSPPHLPNEKEERLNSITLNWRGGNRKNTNFSFDRGSGKEKGGVVGPGEKRVPRGRRGRSPFKKRVKEKRVIPLKIELGGKKGSNCPEKQNSKGRGCHVIRGRRGKKRP